MLSAGLKLDRSVIVESLIWDVVSDFGRFEFCPACMKSENLSYDRPGCRVSVESPHRFRVEVLFSPGASHNPCSVVPIHRDHTLPVVHRHPLHRGQSSPLDPLHCDQIDLFCFQANSDSGGHHSKCSVLCILALVITSRAH